jgi:hypothetical protein
MAAVAYGLEVCGLLFENAVIGQVMDLQRLGLFA